MPSPPPIILAMALLGGAFGVGVMVYGVRVREARPSLSLAGLSILPGFLLLGLFYSLALHMHQSLGGWPSSIGTSSFPSALVHHANVTGWMFTILFLGSILVWPTVVVVCLAVSRWRGALVYLGFFAVACVICFTNMLLAPEGFLYWWWD